MTDELKKSLEENNLRLLARDEPLESGDQFSPNKGRSWLNVFGNRKKFNGVLYARSIPYEGPSDEEMSEYYGDDL